MRTAPQKRDQAYVLSYSVKVRKTSFAPRTVDFKHIQERTENLTYRCRSRSASFSSTRSESSL